MAFTNSSTYLAFKDTMARFENYQFVKSEQQPPMLEQSSETSDTLNSLAVHDIDYYGWGLNIIENFCEGDFTIGKRIKFQRYYKTASTHPEKTMSIFMTKVVDVTVPRELLKGSIAIVHGFAQCSDAFMEMAL